MIRNRLRLAIGVAVILFVILAAVVFWPRDFLVMQTARGTFHLDLPFEKVRLILALTQSTDEIMALGDTGDLKEFDWTKPPALGLATFNIFNPRWDVQATAIMKVQTSNEEYVGSHLITLKQDVDVQDDHLESEILLQKGSDRLKEYKNVTRFSPDGPRTKVEGSITLGILVTAPNFARRHAAGRVLANATGKLQSQEQAIRAVIGKYKDGPLLPIP